MPRTARIHYPGGVFHVISRCLEGRRLIGGPKERERYLDLVEHALSRTDASVLAYCLMSNHVHLVVRAGEERIERLTRPLNVGFAGWLNHRKHRHGPVFADRPKTILVEEEHYLLELVRYVHNNPVRARVVSSAEDSNWSSHRAYLGIDSAPDWLKIAEVLALFSTKPKLAARRFAAFVESGKGQARQGLLSGARQHQAGRKLARVAGDGFLLSDAIVGGDDFVEKVLKDLSEHKGPVRQGRLGDAADLQKSLPDLDDLVGAVCTEVGIEPWQFEERPKSRASALARRLLALIWVQRFKGKQVDLARAFKVPTASVSRWYGRAVDEAPDLESHVDAVLALLPDKPRRRRRSKVSYALTVEND